MDRLYAVDVRGLENPETYGRWYSRMPEARREKTDCFRAEADRRRSLGAGIALWRALLDAGLAGDAEITVEPGGRPRLKEGGLFFNLSHSGQVALCAASDREVGADVQEYRHLENRVLQVVYTPGETAYVLSRAGGDEALRDRLFTSLWTVKESLMKYAGKGLALPPGKISLDFSRGSEPAACAEGMDTGHIRFVTRFLEGHVYTICTEGTCFDADPEWIDLWA